MHALGAPGDQYGSGWRGEGGVHGGSKAWASRGIERWGEGEVGGEVTGPEVVGGVLVLLDALGGHVDVQGRRGVA
jgi:hypothetical protein